MTGRERVKRAIYFQDPDRVPYNFDANRTPEDGIEYGEDMMWVFCSTRGGMEEFGVVYETIDDSFGEPKVFPLKDAESLENYTFPDFSEDWRYEEMREIIKKNNGEKYVLGMFPVGLFQHMIEVFSFEDFLVNCIANPELVEAVCDGFLKICMDTADKMAEAGVKDVVHFTISSGLANTITITEQAAKDVIPPFIPSFMCDCEPRCGLQGCIAGLGPSSGGAGS